MKAFVSPQRYIQGEDTINKLGGLIAERAHSVLVLIDNFLYDSLKNRISQNLDECSLNYKIVSFFGDVTTEKINKLTEIIQDNNYTAIAGIGGGKTLDTVKAVADKTDCFVVVVPTIASSDAPCSSLSIIYDNDMSNRTVHKCKKNPDTVIVDTKILSSAPIRYFAAGIADALATYPEARAAGESASRIFLGDEYKPTRLSLEVSRLCWEILLEHACDAYDDMQSGILSNVLEDVIEAVILLSGLGFENSGCSGAHSISKGLSAVKECENLLHGEKVAFGLLCQLTGEERWQELAQVQKIYRNMALPLTLNNLGIIKSTATTVDKIAVASMKNSFWDNEPIEITENLVRQVILKADILGGIFLESEG